MPKRWSLSFCNVDNWYKVALQNAVAFLNRFNLTIFPVWQANSVHFRPVFNLVAQDENQSQYSAQLQLNHTDNPVNQSKLQANSRNWQKARENACELWTAIGLLYFWLEANCFANYFSSTFTWKPLYRSDSEL